MDGLEDLPVDDAPESRRRTECQRCQRPLVACWCWALPSPRLQVASNIIVLQHPFEERRALRTAPMIQHGLAEGKCVIYRGKRFFKNRHPELDLALSGANSLLLYPAPGATDIRDLAPVGSGQPPTGPYTVVLLDGTWRQARSIYTASPILHSLRKVFIGGGRCSCYVIRTQPSEFCLSTLEAAAYTLHQLEQLQQLALQQLLAPLHALCAVQLRHGAAPHDSRPTQLARGSEYEKIGLRDVTADNGSEQKLLATVDHMETSDVTRKACQNGVGCHGDIVGATVETAGSSKLSVCLPTGRALNSFVARASALRRRPLGVVL